LGRVYVDEVLTGFKVIDFLKVLNESFAKNRVCVKGLDVFFVYAVSIKR